MIKIYITILLSFLGIGIVKGESKKWTLQECIDYGVEQSISMKRQLLTNRVDNLDLRDAALGLLPGVSGSSGIGYNFGRSIDPQTNTYTNTRNMSNSYNLGASMNIFSGFTAINTLRYNKVSKMKGLNDSEKMANDIAVRIMQAFFDVAYSEGLIAISEEQVKNARMQLKKMERQHDLGITPKSDLFDMQGQLAESEYNLIANQNSHTTYMIQLKQEMNYSADEDFTIDALSLSLILPSTSKLSAEEIYNNAKETLPEVQAAEQAVRVAQLNRYIYIGNIFPSISIDGSISTVYADSRDEGFSSQFKNNVGKGFSLGVSIPIFSGLKRQSNISRARYEVKSAELLYKEKLQDVYLEIQQAVQDLKASSQEFTMAIRKESFYSQSFAANQKKYEQGLIDIIGLNTSNNNLLKAKHDVLKAKLTFAIKKRVVDFYTGDPLQVFIK